MNKFLHIKGTKTLEIQSNINDMNKIYFKHFHKVGEKLTLDKKRRTLKKNKLESFTLSKYKIKKI